MSSSPLNPMAANTTPILRFPELLHQILLDAEINCEEHIISWLPCGRKFKIHNTRLFAQSMMPRFFNNNRYKSFLRQLSLYEFRRGAWKNSPGPKGSYDHPYFIKGRVDLAERVIRVKNRHTKTSAWSYAQGDDELKSLSSSSYGSSSTGSSSTFSSEKYLDPRVLVNDANITKDVLEEIISIFSISKKQLMEITRSTAEDDNMMNMTDFEPISDWTALDTSDCDDLGLDMLAEHIVAC